MFIRLALAAVLIVAGLTSALGQGGQAEQHKSDKRKSLPAEKVAAPREVEQKWVEDSIDKFFALPDEILDPPAKHP